jgi:hypothetical protein
VKPAALVTRDPLPKGPKAVVPFSAKTALPAKPVARKKVVPSHAHRVKGKPSVNLKRTVTHSSAPKPKSEAKTKKPSPGIAKNQE